MNIMSSIKEMDDLTKKRIIFFGGIAIILIVLIIIISIIVAIINKKDPYDKVEQTMEKAAYDYLMDNKDMLPNAENNMISIPVDTLVKQEYIKPLYKYTKDKSCDGEVKVIYKDNEYDYQGYLTCDNFKTMLLSEKINEDNPVTTTSDGLYNYYDQLTFRGEYVNNYIKFGNINYRIIKIDNEGKIYITPHDMDDNDETMYVYWDDRYNTEEDSSCGINDYSLSRIKKSVEAIYKNLDNSVKQYTTKFSTCTGKRSSLSIDNSGNIECQNKLENVDISLIPINDYINASLAPSCKTPSSMECKNYNYLIIDESSWWTLTGDADNTFSIYSITVSGQIDKEKGNNKKLARYVLALKPGTLYKEGNGTIEKPYIVR